MKTKIPAGWYRLRTGAEVRTGDRYAWQEDNTWNDITPCDLTLLVHAKEIIIRKRKVRRSDGKKEK